MFTTRRRTYQIFGKRKPGCHDSYLDSEVYSESYSESSSSLDELMHHDSEHDEGSEDIPSIAKHPSKRRRVCGLTLHTPNSSRFSDHVHSRIMQKYPFLVEMFYWIITYQFYRLTKIISQRMFSEAIIEVSQMNGLAILELEQFSWASLLFPWKERDVQQWFMHGHQDALTLLNRFYALVHIPGTVGWVVAISCICPVSTAKLD